MCMQKKSEQHLSKLAVDHRVALRRDAAVPPLAVPDKNIFHTDGFEHADGDAPGESPLVLCEDVLSSERNLASLANLPDGCEERKWAADARDLIALVTIG